jgi:hypothetical protein
LGCGYSTQGTEAIAIGRDSGRDNQQNYAISIGSQAGKTNQGQYSIAIGYQAGITNQASQSISVNASTTSLNVTYSGFFARPIRLANSTGITDTPNLLMYDTTNNEICCSTVSTVSSKTFVIEHPDDKDKYLVHSCLEGPEAGVYYRGNCEVDEFGPDTGSIEFTDDDNEIIYFKKIKLPKYVKNLAKDLTVNVSPLITPQGHLKHRIIFPRIVISEIENINDELYFYIYSDKKCKANWMVFGKRHDIEVEVDKTKVKIKGNGPYRWI